MSKEQKPLISDERIRDWRTERAQTHASFPFPVTYNVDSDLGAYVQGCKLVRDLYEIARSKDTDLIKEAHKVIGMLLASKDCWTNGEPEIIQEISAQFDLVIDDAQMIIDVTKRINERSK